MDELFFVWVAVLIQAHSPTSEQVRLIHQAWQPACAEQGGELVLSGSPRIWNGKEAFVVEGRCTRGDERGTAPPREHA
jgi:hypothetical protein